jgi:glucosamine kinase
VIRALIGDVLAMANRTETRPAVCVVGVAGAGQERAAQALWSALASRRIADDVSVQADATIALDDAFGDARACCWSPVRGPFAFARAPDGRMSGAGAGAPPLATKAARRGSARAR